ncbi:MAG: dihydroxyacetone kinase subunit L [Acidobacteria bacterium]|nr:dihydroxyacetone kinase subunit L [Acidobacteriota bacterium]
MGLVNAINANRELLSEIDGAIGDGDHGINMSTGFTRFRESVEGKQLTFASALDALGTTLLEVTGGSLGPLYGSMFMAMAESVSGKENIDAPSFLVMLETGRDSMMEIGGAKPGDKTLLDSLCPAIDSYRTALASGATFTECLQAMARGAETGKDSTRDMIARIGRASRLGERSRGVLDAGATSCSILLNSLAQSLQSQLEKTK